ncbi:MAG: DNA-binding protein WhiA [Clostridiales bacterium]|nr:DNA-binding protein WhiA [Clostridiales bacterium]
MSFSSKVKNEIAKLQDENPCCQIAELSALIKMNGTIRILGRNRIGIKLTTENAAIARNIFSLIKSNFDFNTKVAMTKNKQLKKNYSYTLLVDSNTASENILRKLLIVHETANGPRINNKIPSSIIKNVCCKRAYLRGVFLGGGSISDPEKTYHLEIVTNNESYAKDIKKLINSFGLNSKIVVRKNNYVVYLKEGENIVDFLNIIGAHSALLNLENVRIYKEMRNNVNRLVNCETANLSKTVNAAMRQVKNIEYIKEHMGLDKLPKSLRDIAEARLEHQDASLRELGEMMDPVVGKSGVNHRLRKLDELAESLRRKSQ